MEPTGTTAPRSRSSGLLIARRVIVIVLLLACFGGASVVGRRAMRATDDTTTSTMVAKGLSGPGRTAPAGSNEPETVSGPRPSTYPVRTEDDLKRVCDNWYYPKSPKVKSTGMQPVSIFTQDEQQRSIRNSETLYDIPDWFTKRKQQAWDPKSPAKVRLVACVDPVGRGKKVRTCTFDDPKDLKVPMVQGRLRLRLYEVATGKLLVDKRLTGEDEECPYFVLLRDGEPLISGAADRQLYEILRKRVEK